MNKGSAVILNVNDNALEMVASASRISTTEGNAIQIYQKAMEKTKAENAKSADKALSSKHTSTLEHCMINIAFNDVSMYVEQFLIEFRLAAFTVKSRRYVDFGDAGFITPRSFETFGEPLVYFMNSLFLKYERHNKKLFALYNKLIDTGVPKEDARFVLPYAFRSNFYCSVNAREFLHIVSSMVYGKGKDFPEIHALGCSLMEQAAIKMPWLPPVDECNCEKLDYSGLGIEAESVNLQTDELVSILRSTPDIEKIICQTACFKHGIECKWPLPVSAQNEIIKDVIRSPHRRELEQVAFHIRINRLSLAVLTHLTRHRMHSLVIPDLLEVCSADRYIMPQSVIDAGMEEEYRQAFKDTAILMSNHDWSFFNPNDRIYCLLTGMTVPIKTTINANELLTICMLRTCNRAQWEIRNIFKELIAKLREKNPLLFSHFGPSCHVTGECPEGKKTCGHPYDGSIEISKD